MLSMLIPCRNEAGNIPQIFKELRNLHHVSEYVFIEGGSSDSTFSVIQDHIKLNQDLKVKLVKQSGRGKFAAVMTGAKTAESEYLAIWDADLTIDSFDQNALIDLYLSSNNLDFFVTANRLNPQIHDSAMRRLNLYGNHFFALASKIVTGLNVPDVLAGTKIFPKKLLTGDAICPKAISLDPFGDLFLISRASYFKLHIKCINCEYKPRSYGQTNIPRWSGGFKLFRFLIHLIAHGCHKR